MGHLVQHEPIAYPHQQFGSFSEGCMDFLQKMLEKQADSRITAAAALSHSWLKATIDS
jgi:serine/threonine protein kinase